MWKYRGLTEDKRLDWEQGVSSSVRKKNLFWGVFLNQTDVLDVQKAIKHTEGKGKTQKHNMNVNFGQN